MKLNNFEEELGSFLRFLEGEKKHAQKTLFQDYQHLPEYNWRQLESWAHSHSDPDVRAVCTRAFHCHDQDAMNQLQLEHAWFLRQNE
jgi:hypothetical protein